MKNDLNNCVEQIVRNVCANMRLEGFNASEETKEKCYAIVLGERDADDLVREYIENYYNSNKYIKHMEKQDEGKFRACQQGRT